MAGSRSSTTAARRGGGGAAVKAVASAGRKSAPALAAKAPAAAVVRGDDRCLKRKGSSLSCSSAVSAASTRAPSSSGLDSESELSLSPSQPKRRCLCEAIDGQQRRRRQPFGSRELCAIAHQFGLVGGDFYDSKEGRLLQLLERLPRGADGAPCALIFADPAAEREVFGAVAAHLQAAGDSPHVQVLIGRSPRLPPLLERCLVVINYNLPSSAEEYLRRAAVVHEASVEHPDLADRCGAVMYSLVQERQLGGVACTKIRELLARARRMAKGDASLGGTRVAALDSALMYLANDYDDDGEDDGEGDEDGDGEEDACDCNHCCSGSLASVSLHAVRPRCAATSSSAPSVVAAPRVEVVRVPLQALTDFGSLAPYIAPRVSPEQRACTLICLHNMYCHTPWDGYEHMFALPEGMGSVRVVMVLATGSSWHDYPDVGSFSGGVAWTDILDMDSMDAADSLIERLVEHEVALLGGQGERLVLMGASQGGGQSMLRFLRSQRRLGGWIGSVCHAPTAPHTPVARDPLTAAGRSMANLAAPVRLLAGELDTTFPAPLVLRDVQRLREVGGFTDVAVTVQKGMTHEGPEASESLPPELLFLQRHLPSMVPAAASCTSRPASPTASS